MNKSVYLGVLILDIRKTLMCEFWNDYIKTKYQDNAKLCYMYTDSFVIYVKTEDFYKDIIDDVEKWFDTSNYSKDDKRPLPIRKNKKVIGLFKDELGGKIIIESVGLRAKTQSYLVCDDNENKQRLKFNYYSKHKKAKGTNKSVIKRGLQLNDSKECLLKNKIILKLEQRFKSENHNVYTEEINKIA